MGQPLVESYRFGRITLKGRAYERDLIVTPEGVLHPWWRMEGHLLSLEDLGDAANADVKHVVIGTGYYGAMRVEERVVEHFKRRGAEVYVADTREAVRVYNELVQRGERVLGAFHLTC